MKKIIAILLMLCSVMPLIIGCGNNSGDTDTTAEITTSALETKTETEVTTENPYDENGYIKDSVPDTLKYTGTTIRMLRWIELLSEEFEIENVNGTLVNDALYAKQLKTEERLGVKFEYSKSKALNDDAKIYLQTVATSYDSGDPYDLYAAHAMATPLVATNGYCQDLLNYSVIDFSKPWWPDALLSQAKINGKLYFCSGDISLNLLYMMFGVYFNKKLLNSCNLENPYELVKSNTWTFDKLFEMCKNADFSTNVESEKIYAFSVKSYAFVDSFFYSAGLEAIKINNDGLLEISEKFSNERCIDVLTVAGEFMNQPYNSLSSGDTLFKNERSLFLLHWTQYSVESLPDVDIQYGIVPMPKYTADMETYPTATGFRYSIYGIGGGAKNSEAAAAAMEVMASESYRTVTPAAFEITLKTRYSQESDAGQMYDIIKNAITFDPGRLFARDFNELTFSMYRFAISSNTGKNYASTFQKNAKTLKKVVNSINESFTK